MRTAQVAQRRDPGDPERDVGRSLPPGSAERVADDDAGRDARQLARAARGAPRPRRRGRAGAGSACPGPLAFDASTPAEAHTKPCRVRAITSGGRERTTSADSRRITSTWRGSPSSPASSTARGDGSTSSSRTTRPSTFDTAFCATTTTSPASRPPTRVAGVGQQPPEIVPLLELGNARQADDPHLGAVARIFVLIQHKSRRLSGRR